MEDILKIIAQYLNIEMSDRNTIAIIEGDLECLPYQDISSFLLFVKESCNSEKLNFKTGFQKFNSLIEDFKKQRVQLNEMDHKKIYKYVDELNNKVIVIFELIESQLYKNNVSPFSDNGKKYIESESITNDIKKYLDEKGLKVVDTIGRPEVCRMVKHNRYGLQEEIRKVVTGLSRSKKAQTLGYAPKNKIGYHGAYANQISYDKRVSV